LKSYPGSQRNGDDEDNYCQWAAERQLHQVHSAAAQQKAKGSVASTSTNEQIVIQLARRKRVKMQLSRKSDGRPL